MYLFVGLGNPERKYENTKHNCGFCAIEELIDHYNVPSSGVSLKGMYGKMTLGGEKVMLMKPLTYMNLSGEAVRAYVDYYKLDPARDLVVIYDDVDLPIGTIRIKQKGSAGSHNGMKSIISHLGTQEFTRVRIGIGPKPQGLDLAYYVLSPFSKAERKLIDEAVSEIVPIAELITAGKTERAMDHYNQKQ